MQQEITRSLIPLADMGQEKNYLKSQYTSFNGFETYLNN